MCDKNDDYARRMDLAMVEAHIAEFKAGLVSCFRCGRAPASVLCRMELDPEDSAKLFGREPGYTTFANVACCASCMALPDIMDRIDVFLERKLANPMAANRYNVGSIDVDHLYRSDKY